MPRLHTLLCAVSVAITVLLAAGGADAHKNYKSKFITASELATYTTPIWIESAVEIVDGECQRTVRKISPDTQVSVFDFVCTFDGVELIDIQTSCPSGYIASQGACTNFSDLDFSSLPLFYAVQDATRCRISVASPDTAYIGQWLMCSRAGGTAALAAAASSSSSSSPSGRDSGANWLAAAAVAKP